VIDETFLRELKEVLNDRTCKSLGNRHSGAARKSRSERYAALSAEASANRTFLKDTRPNRAAVDLEECILRYRRNLEQMRNEYERFRSTSDLNQKMDEKLIEDTDSVIRSLFTVIQNWRNRASIPPGPDGPRVPAVPPPQQIPAPARPPIYPPSTSQNPLQNLQPGLPGQFGLPVAPRYPSQDFFSQPNPPHPAPPPIVGGQSGPVPLPSIHPQHGQHFAPRPESPVSLPRLRTWPSGPATLPSFAQQFGDPRDRRTQSHLPPPQAPPAVVGTIPVATGQPRFSVPVVPEPQHRQGPQTQGAGDGALPGGPVTGSPGQPLDRRLEHPRLRKRRKLPPRSLKHGRS
jgi:hypothetical protein